MPGTPQEPGDGTTCAFVSKLPDDYDQCIALYDTAGLNWGRAQSGKRWLSPGLKVLVRALTYGVGYALAQSIADGLDLIVNQTVIASDMTTHYVKTVTRTGTIISLGEEIFKQRQLFSINARVAYQDQEPVQG